MNAILNNTQQVYTQLLLWLQVFVHSPHHKHGLQGSGGGRLTASSTDTDIQLLSIGQQITAIATGRSVHEQTHYGV